MPCRHFCSSDLTTVPRLYLQTSAGSHHAPSASVRCVWSPLRRCEPSRLPEMFSMTIPQAPILIKITSGESKLAPISVPVLKFQLGWVKNRHVILFYLLSIIFDGLYSSNKITDHLACDSMTFTLCCPVSLCRQHIKTWNIISEAGIEKGTKS